MCFNSLYKRYEIVQAEKYTKGPPITTPRRIERCQLGMDSRISVTSATRLSHTIKPKHIVNRQLRSGMTDIRLRTRMKNSQNEAHRAPEQDHPREQTVAENLLEGITYDTVAEGNREKLGQGEQPAQRRAENPLTVSLPDPAISDPRSQKIEDSVEVVC